MNPLEEGESTMPKYKIPKSLLLIAVLISLSALVGCTAAIPPELTAADQAIAAARQAGKDKDCPNEFNAAEKMKNEAYAICKPCDQEKAIAMAKEALKKTNALCPPRPTPVPTPVAVVKPPAPAPSVSFSANPASVKQGECATLTWSSSNASGAAIDQGIGRVGPNGSQKVCPDRTTQYSISATGEGGSREASTTVTVAPRVVDRLTLHVNFDFNKATVKKADDADVQKAVEFLRKYPGYKISLEGYTDNIGGEAYNQDLSEKRAAAVKELLVSKRGIDGSKIQTSGHGASNPVADNATAEGRAKNRRVEILILSE